MEEKNNKMSVSLVDYNSVDLYSDPAGIFSIQCSLGFLLNGIGGHKLRFLQENCQKSKEFRQIGITLLLFFNLWCLLPSILLR